MKENHSTRRVDTVFIPVVLRPYNINAAIGSVHKGIDVQAVAVRAVNVGSIVSASAILGNRMVCITTVARELPEWSPSVLGDGNVVNREATIGE
jgi:hypothetical protein